jgi:hypothetical protein
MCSWVWRPFRVQDRDVEFDEPVVEPAEAAPAPEAPPVSALVERSGPGINPAVVDEYLAHAIAKKWLRDDGDQLAPGTVNPVPVVQGNE